MQNSIHGSGSQPYNFRLDHVNASADPEKQNKAVTKTSRFKQKMTFADSVRDYIDKCPAGDLYAPFVEQLQGKTPGGPLTNFLKQLFPGDSKPEARMELIEFFRDAMIHLHRAEEGRLGPQLEHNKECK